MLEFLTCFLKLRSLKLDFPTKFPETQIPKMRSPKTQISEIRFPDKIPSNSDPRNEI